MPAADIVEVLAKCAVTRRWAVGMCGQFCAAMYGYGFSGYRNAITQWQKTPPDLKFPRSGAALPGALVFWAGGSAGHGHVAIADGTGHIFSTDISGPGTVSRVPLDMIERRWGQPYLGWTVPYFQGERWSPVGIYGTDVSNYQPGNFLLELPGSSTRKVDFAIIKITEGTTYTNPKWITQRQRARDHGLSVGFYHFARPGSMKNQADYFLSRVALQPGDHLWFDWEDTGVSSAQKDEWIRYVQQRAPGHRVGLYCNTHYWKNRDTSSFAGDALWIATGGIPIGQPPITAPWLIHQFSTEGNYDHDWARFNSRAEMIAWANGDEEEMALTTDDINKVANAVVAKLIAGGGVLENSDLQRILDFDRVPAARPPFHNADYFEEDGVTVKNAYWPLKYTVQTAVENARAARAAAEANTVALAALTEAVAGLDLSGLPDAIAAKLAKIRLVLEEEV